MPSEFLWAKHILTNPQARWDLMSSFHKSLRSGIIGLAMNWGRIFVLKMGEKTVRSYLKRIIFEETRNLTLYSMMLEDKPIFELISAFTRSKKKWQLTYFRDHCLFWNLGYRDYLEHLALGYNSEFESQLSNQLFSLDKRNLYLKNYQFQDYKVRDAELLSFIERNTPSKFIQDFIRSKNKAYGSMYYRMVLLELVNGWWENEANNFNSEDEDTTFYVPKRNLWYFDIHTKAISRFIKSNYLELRPGPNYIHGHIDLRLSGQILGVWFRFNCREPFSKTWNEVELSEIDWELIHMHEKRYYDI